MWFKKNNDFLFISEEMINRMKSNYVTDVVERHLKSIKSYLGKKLIRKNVDIFKDSFKALEDYNWFQGYKLVDIFTYNQTDPMIPFCDFTDYVNNNSIAKIKYLWCFLEDYIKAGGAVRFDGNKITSISGLKDQMDYIIDYKNTVKQLNIKKK